jgi:hypothetical protein
VGAKGADHAGGQGDRPAAPLRLRLHELEASIHPLQCLWDAKLAGVEVHVRPAQTEDLPLAKAQGKTNGVEGLKPVASAGRWIGLTEGRGRLGILTAVDDDAERRSRAVRTLVEDRRFAEGRRAASRRQP